MARSRDLRSESVNMAILSTCLIVVAVVMTMTRGYPPLAILISIPLPLVAMVAANAARTPVASCFAGGTAGLVVLFLIVGLQQRYSAAIAVSVTFLVVGLMERQVFLVAFAALGVVALGILQLGLGLTDMEAWWTVLMIGFACGASSLILAKRAQSQGTRG